MAFFSRLLWLILLVVADYHHPVTNSSSIIHHLHLPLTTHDIISINKPLEMLPIFSCRAQQRKEAHRQARGEAIAGVTQLHKLLNEFSQMHILPTQHNTLGVKCQSFPIDQNSDDQSPSAPSDRAFFLPRTVPPLDITNPTQQRQASYLSRCWGGDKQANRSTTLRSQTCNLWSRLGRMFVDFPRQEEPLRAGGYQRSLRQISQWIPR